MNITVIGAGAWGTALAITLAKHHPITLWTRNAEQMAQMSVARCNARYLPQHVFPDGLTLVPHLPAALAYAELVLVVVPTAGLRETLGAIAPNGRRISVIWACKGFERGGGKLPHQVARDVLPDDFPCGVLSGPSFAQEVAAGLPTALTLASSDTDFASTVAVALHGHRLRIYTSRDIIGVEVGGAVKNVMAIAAGISDGLGFGHNARAALITRGLAEIARLGTALGGQSETFMGLTGAGDLILTCTGDLSRNRLVGLQLAENKPLDTILEGLGHVAEGVHSAREVLALAQAHGVDMPITQAVCQVLYDHTPAAIAVESLLNRAPKAESVN